MNMAEIKQVAQAWGGPAERYYARAIQGLTDEQARAFIDSHERVITMPCGLVRIIKRSAEDELCPNSGKCAAGIKECWVVKRFP